MLHKYPRLLRGGRAVANYYIKTTQQLAERIESLRYQMIKIATVEGFTSEDSLATSRELDRLLNLYDLYQNQTMLKCNTNK